MAKILVVITFILVLSSSPVLASSETLSSLVTPTPAVEYSLPYPGILPDHPLYPLKALRDRILLFFTKDPVRRVHLRLLLGDKRVAMGQVLWEKGSYDLSVTTFTKAEKYLLTTSIDLTQLKKQNILPPGLADKVEMAAKKHEEIIRQLATNVTDESKRQGLTEALGINHQATQQILSVK